MTDTSTDFAAFLATNLPDTAAELSAACTIHGQHDLYEGPHDDRPDQTLAWYDHDPGARPALPTEPIEVCS